MEWVMGGHGQGRKMKSGKQETMSGQGWRGNSPQEIQSALSAPADLYVVPGEKQSSNW